MQFVQFLSQNNQINFKDGTGVSIHSKYNPEQESDRFYSSKLPLPDEINIFGGGGLYILDSILKHNPIPKKIHLYEPFIEFKENELLKKKFLS